jgi:hypothetical protein
MSTQPIQPWLILGAGRAGQEILTQSKATLSQRYGTVPEYVRFIALDSAAPIEPAYTASGIPVALVPGSEFLGWMRHRSPTSTGTARTTSGRKASST